MSIKTIVAVALLVLLAASVPSQAQKQQPEAASLCSLQQQIGAGEHQSVRVSGIYSEGPELGLLEDEGCPKEDTWVVTCSPNPHKTEYDFAEGGWPSL